MKKIMKRPLNSLGGKSQLQSACQVQVNMPKGGHANPLRILEPNRKRLTSLKAERVFRVSEENIKNVQIVLILPEVIDSLERLNIAFGQELYAMLKEHDILRQKYDNNVYLLQEGKRLEKEYNEWLEMKERQGDLFSESSSESRSESGQQEEEFVIQVKGQNMTTLHQNVAMTADELSYSVKNILRKFRSDPTATKAVLELAKDLSGMKRNFVKGLQDLQSIVREKLLTTPVELEERKYYIGKVVQRENKILKIKEKLQIDYDQQIKIKKEEEEKQSAVINKLKETLQSLNEASSKECSKILNDASQRIKADVKNSDAKQKVFAQQFIETKKTSGDQLKQNYEEEREKRKRKFKLSTEVFNWIQKYDADMGMRQVSLVNENLVWPVRQGS
ncbi:Hypothetical predicted protein [Paramuricea clavata]|uniref:Dynein regulatory complex protein 10 n=1 Tax=Paramuricea clavata TaxID=317549 RepID=A0A7D9EUE8_PARCT|nr:Hypothetical predicted protein [Paramuricea clavata]